MPTGYTAAIKIETIRAAGRHLLAFAGSGSGNETDFDLEAETSSPDHRYANLKTPK